MPDVYENEVKTEPVAPTVDESELIGKLFRYLDNENNPWRYKYINETLKECYDFKELRQWSGADEALLNSLEVPAISIDRINRGLDNITGIRANTGTRKRIVKRELGDERIAHILDRVCDYVDYHGNFEAVDDEAFTSLCDVGIGVMKVGFDPQADGGEGAIWRENCNIEDLFWKWGKRKDLSDVPWIVHEQVMDWEEAMMIAPEKAGQLKTLRNMVETEWNKIQSGSVQGQSTAVDYNSTGRATSATRPYPNQVKVLEFWIKHRQVMKKIGTVQNPMMGGMPPQMGDMAQGGMPPMGQAPMMPQPQVRIEKGDYQPQMGEQELATFVQEEYQQFVVASSGVKQGSILLKASTARDHPFVAECAEKKKNGAPRGYIEICIPHQRRGMLAWAQETAFYNKAIKSPIVTIGGNYKIEDVIHSSKLGSILDFPTGTQVVSINTVPNVNMRAVEERNSAWQDMDFAAAATEGSLRGVSEPGASGLKLSLQQNASITPVSKWIKAEQASKIPTYRKVLGLILQYFNPQKVARIIGEQEFMKLIQGGPNPLTGEDLPPLQWPPQIDATNYDVVIEDQSVSDFNKQQSFNAAMALKNSGTILDDQFMIKNAPIKNTDDALDSNIKAKTDILRQLMNENNMLKQQLGQMQKQIPPSQRQNAMTGAQQPQAGANSMLGGARGMPPGPPGPPPGM